MQTGEPWRTNSGLLLTVPILVLLAACADKRQQPRDVTGADAVAGLAVIERLGCAACHQIPGVDWPKGTVGGSLDGFADRSMIAGRFPNQPKTLSTWVTNAPSMTPTTGMPAMPMKSAEARNVAAYLYTLEDD